MSSIKFRVILLAKHWTYQTLNECINAAVVILPIEKYKLKLNQALIFSAQTLLMSSKIFFAAREWNDRQTVDESNSIQFKTTFVGEHTTNLFNSNGTSKYLRCDFAE